MKRLLCLFGFLLAGGFRPVAAAELKIMSPLDRSVVRGTVQFRIAPVHGPNEQYFSDPDIVLEDEYGRLLKKLIAVRDPKSGLCVASLDTTQVPDGLCEALVTYRTLMGGTIPQSWSDEITLAVRNGAARPARFKVEIENREYHPGESCDVAVTVYDQKGKPMPGARVAFKVSKGDVDTDAEITDRDGEAGAGIDSDDPQQITLTVTVEALPPVTQVVRFVSKPSDQKD